VIIGFGIGDAPGKTIYHYPESKGEPLAVAAANINPYLVDADDILLTRKRQPLCRVPKMFSGNNPLDGGNYLFTPGEMERFVEQEPRSAQYFRRWIGNDEFLYGNEAYCLWLGDCPPEELRRMPEVLKRVEAVKRFRLQSRSPSTRRQADTPTRFHVEITPKGNSLVFPVVSSEKRKYIPLGYVGPDTLCGVTLRLIPDATLWHFGVLHSAMHMAWTAYTCGRLESRYQYSVHIVYNNFPWPWEVLEGVRSQVEAAAQGVLDARAKFPTSNLADLYDPLTMPPELLEAHRALDRAVDAAYLATLPKGFAKPKLATDLDRVAFLFRLYEHYTGGLGLAPVAKTRKATRPRQKRIDPEDSGAGD